MRGRISAPLPLTCPVACPEAPCRSSAAAGIPYACRGRRLYKRRRRPRRAVARSARLRHLTSCAARGIDHGGGRTAGRDCSCGSNRPGSIDAVFVSPTTRADCRDGAHCDGGRRGLLSDRLPRRISLGLDVGGGGCRAGWASHEDTGAYGAAVLHTGRDPAGSGGHPGNAEGNSGLAAECRASGGSGHLHDDRHRLLFALGARLGSSIGIARRESGFDGASDGALGRVQRRCARNRDRARDARTLDRARFARGTGAVRLNGRARGIELAECRNRRCSSLLPW